MSLKLGNVFLRPSPLFTLRQLVSDITLLRRPGKPRLIRRWLKRKLKTAA
jgi:hypothetical protein